MFISHLNHLLTTDFSTTKCIMTGPKGALRTNSKETQIARRRSPSRAQGRLRTRKWCLCWGSKRLTSLWFGKIKFQRNRYKNFPIDIAGCSQSLWHYIISNKRGSLLIGEPHGRLLTLSLNAPTKGHTFMAGAARPWWLAQFTCLLPLSSKGVEMGHKFSLFFVSEQLLSSLETCSPHPPPISIPSHRSSHFIFFNIPGISRCEAWFSG